MNETLIASLRERLGPKSVLTGDDIPRRNWADETKLEPVRPAALILPRDTMEVSIALRLCNEAGQAVVTQGGLTGLAAGAHPMAGEFALSLEKMKGIEEIDPVAGTLTALAGTTLADVQAAAEQAGFHCGIDLGARGSCSIGGNVATNAGGNQVLRYGMTRKNILGLEAVQADGTILTSLNKMMKNNTGYDWTQLLVGSEGTLAVITRVVVALHPRPKAVETVLVALPSAASAMTLLKCLEETFGAGLMVFEGMWSEFVSVATEQLGIVRPFAEEHDLIVLAEIAPGGDNPAEAVEEALGALLEEGIIVDAIIARSGGDAQRLWSYRESVYEYQRLHATQIGFDISIPRPAIGDAVADLRALRAAHWPGALQVVFGHIADSNLHIVIGPRTPGGGIDAAETKAVETGIYDIVRRHHGSISAEHGIGRAKRPYLAHSRTEAELKLMQAIKVTLDPKGILNQGRVI
ncbi:FAD-binding oxidoreductase [Acuticoccus sp. M5D2P5]|uniref:FAD-binding oxidoreductase n=1 Tax=Acuticoccus kalidii TaxID=2910977 RepID=UPI001F397D83|nr:FAD-binding oxidoreductase [Acuticoccus kalidii]MCF3933683.1 FAD-binding oxidoreductase [Acuticoccus kalidii]